ncbi:MAG: LolA-related protein [Burkholderiaceae bacterium]
MKPAAPVRSVFLAVWFALGGAAGAQPITTATLQRLLQAAPRHELRFTELRESAWLATPLQSSGTMKASASLLEKRVEQPRRETWRLLPDRMQLLSPDSGAMKEFLFRDAPAVAALANALRDAMAGNLGALEKDFELSVAGDERSWTVQLMPRGPELSRTLKQLELQGTHGRLLAFVILESQGERTTTRLLHE